MNTFAYRGFDTSGKAVKGLIEALDLKEAREKLIGRGVYAEQVTKAGASRLSFSLRKKTAFPTRIRSILYRELAALIKSGIPLVQALDLLIQTPDFEAQSLLLADLRDRVREGGSLADAIIGISIKIYPYETAVIEAGETSGRLEVTLERLADYLDREADLLDKIKTALMYPSIILSLSLVIIFFMLGVLLPSLGKVMREANIELPAVTRFCIAIGEYVFPIIVPLVVIAGVGVAVLISRLRTHPEWQVKRDHYLFNIPVYGRMLAPLVNLRFARTLELLLEGGVPIIEGLNLAARSTGNVWVVQMVKTEAEAVSHGKNLADAIRAVPPLGQRLGSWVAAGQVGGNLRELLGNASERFEQQWSRTTTRFLGALEPVLIIIVGALVLLFSLSILLPILKLNSSLM